MGGHSESLLQYVFRTWCAERGLDPDWILSCADGKQYVSRGLLDELRRLIPSLPADAFPLVEPEWATEPHDRRSPSRVIDKGDMLARFYRPTPTAQGRGTVSPHHPIWPALTERGFSGLKTFCEVTNRKVATVSAWVSGRNRCPDAERVALQRELGIAPEAWDAAHEAFHRGRRSRR